MHEPWDCIVVGGGAAGLSAALVLGRARLRTLVVDAGQQSNLPAHGIGGLLGHDGRPPADLYAMGRAELAQYPSVEVRDGRVETGAQIDDRFELTLADGTVELARRVVLATGMDYRYPDLPGIAERWGWSVFHCPFCHGWEARDGQLAVLDGDPATGVHRSLLLRRWSDDVTLLTNGPATLTDDDRARLHRAGVTIDERGVVGLRGPGHDLDGVELADGDVLACDGLLTAVTLHQRSDLAQQLGATIAPPNPLLADAIVVDPMAATSVPGLTAAGDTSAMMPFVAVAIAAGSIAAATVVRSIVDEEHGLVAH